MADTYEKDLAQKTSLTTSDYIRVVGSDNVSYKQGISSVMQTMGVGKVVAYGTLSTFYTDFSAMPTYAKYFVTITDDCAAALGLPRSTYKGYVSKSSETICDMTVQIPPSGIEYIGRVTFDSSGNVTASTWTKLSNNATVTSCTAVSSSLTFGSQNKVLWMDNRLVQVTVVFTLSASVSAGTTLFTVPKTMRIAGLFNCRLDNGTVYLIGNTDNQSAEIKALQSSLPAGNYRATFVYIADAA